MAATETVIGNRALTKLGVARVTAFADDSKQARALTANYESIRDAELRRHVWKFATTRTTLEAMTEAPAWGFDRQFVLPADFLRLVQVNDHEASIQLVDYRDAPDPPYALEDNRILTSLAAPLKVRYVKLVTDPSLFDALFAEALACKLAEELAEELTQSASKGERAAKQYEMTVRDARRLDAIEKPSEGIPDDSWVTGRL